MTEILKICDSGVSSLLLSPLSCPESGQETKFRQRQEVSIMQNSNIITAARGWIGTPFHHQGRLKNVGVDCLGLLIGVAIELGLHDNNGNKLSDYDDRTYGHIPDEKLLYNGLCKVLTPVKHVAAGNVGLFSIDKTARHLGVFGDGAQYLTLIHAYAPARKVVEHRFDNEWKDKLVMAFSLS